MYIYDIIEKKRYSKTLSQDEIDYVIQGFVNKEISDAQMSAFLMAVVLNGMTYNETYNLTHAMKNSGTTLNFDEFIVDKHSTGGVSDSTTLILAPIVATLGITMAKMSGRSLGFTGGTIDKLEVFEGYEANKSIKDFKNILSSIQCSIISQTENLAYADKLIYDLRNKTATVDSLPLIASSIMSKKLASGSKFLLLNVHYGSGAFMKSKRDALRLAKIMVKIGKDSNIKTQAVVSNMNSPLSGGVGSALEVKSALKCLNGYNDNLLVLSKYLANIIVSEVKKIAFKDAKILVDKAIENKTALMRLKNMVELHGGSVDIIDNFKLFKVSKYQVNIVAQKSGYVRHIDALGIAKLVNHIQSDTKDNAMKTFVGCEIVVGYNQKVCEKQVLAVLHLQTKTNLMQYEQQLLAAINIGCKKIFKPKLIIKRIK